TIFLDEAAIEDFIPQNQGAFRPIKVVAPQGSLFNPNYPRSCYLRFPQEIRAIDLVIKALTQVVPQKTIAGCSSLQASGFSGFNEERREYWAALLIHPGSHGGRHGSDGWDSCCTTLGNVRNTPLEELELRYPVKCIRYEMRNDVPPAAGKWRGGISAVVEHQFLAPGFVANIGDRFYEKPWGVFGGSAGEVASTIMNPGSAGEVRLPSKIQAYPVEAGDLIRNVGANSGGYGDPCERDPAQVLSDVLDGYITLEIAAEVYGVVIDPETMEVAMPATEAKRRLLNKS
ncbi:MAG: hydantoinase B/oxoprolinase family protein, partial [Dehalococcoidia bacterium]